MTNLRIRPAVAALPRYVPSMTAPGAVKISSNEMPTPPSPAVLEAIARELETINRYPDLTAAPLREALAKRFGVGADQVCVGTGSSAILVAALSAVCQPGTQVVYPWRSFESYPIAVPSVGGDPVPVELLPDGTHDLDAMRAAITPDTVAVIVCSPNNPTGPALTYEEIAAFVADVPDDVMIAERERIIPALRGLGYDIPDSQSNFYLIRGDVYGLVEACARVGLIVRPFSVGVRVSVGSREQNDLFLSVATEFARTSGIGA